MKLLISLTYYSPHISGLTLSMRYLAELLAANGYEVVVVAAQHEKRLPLHEKMNGVAVTRVPYLFRLSKGFMMPAFVASAYEAVRHVDVVMITLPQAEGFLVVLLAKLLHKKVVCLYICEVTISSNRITQTHVIVSLLRFVNRMTIFFADKIVTLTDDFAKHNEILKKRKVHGVYPVMISPQIDNDQRDILLHKFSDKKYYIGYLGRISQEKGISYLLEAIPLLQKEFNDEFVIVLAGPKKTVGEEEYQKKISSLLERYPELVVHLGELSDRQLGAFYSLLDVFVLPSTNNTEAFGMVQVEAMYCGTPVVTTDLPGVRVPVQKTGMGELVPAQNVESLAEGICKVLKNRKHYVKSKETIAEIFSAEKILKKYQELLTP